jgi:hypothetical protein
MNEWKAFGGRITLFPTLPPSSSPSSALELYRRIWSNDPDSFQKQDNALLPTVAQGRRGSLIVNCAAQPARIDFNLTAALSQAAEEKVALIDHPIELRNELTHIIDALGNDLLTGISRVALELRFLNPKASHAEANKALTEIIPRSFGVTVTDEEDFIFQINRPHMSGGLQDIRMNFITKWSVERFQVFTILFPMVGATAGAGVTSPSLQPRMFIAASVAFDNNNNINPGHPLTGKEQSALLHEAVDATVQMQHEIGLNIEGF